MNEFDDLLISKSEQNKSLITRIYEDSIEEEHAEHELLNLGDLNEQLVEDGVELKGDVQNIITDDQADDIEIFIENVISVCEENGYVLPECVFERRSLKEQIEDAEDDVDRLVERVEDRDEKIDFYENMGLLTFLKMKVFGTEALETDEE